MTLLRTLFRSSRNVILGIALALPICVVILWVIVPRSYIGLIAMGFALHKVRKFRDKK